MKRTELNTIFTAKVNEYLAKGYTFNTETMAGSQGEIAKVDLTNGEEIIRVIMEREYNWELGDYFTIIVGRATEVEPGIGGSTIWNKDLEVLDQEIFYKAAHNSDYLITKEEAERNANKHQARLARRTSNMIEEVITDKALIKALVPYIQHLKGCKSVKARHLTRVSKRSLSDGTYRYTICIEKKNTLKVETLSENTLKSIRTSC